jgi:hypothetical protein
MIMNTGAFFCSAKKPGFPLQVLGSAHALPAGFPLQSLARQRGFYSGISGFYILRIIGMVSWHNK